MDKEQIIKELKEIKKQIERYRRWQTEINMKGFKHSYKIKYLKLREILYKISDKIKELEK